MTDTAQRALETTILRKMQWRSLPGSVFIRHALLQAPRNVALQKDGARIGAQPSSP